MHSELRPKRLDYSHMAVNDQVWAVLDECWASDPAERQTIENILLQFSRLFHTDEGFRERKRYGMPVLSKGGTWIPV